MTPLQELQAMPIIGNAYHDRPRFNAADAIIRDESATLEDRLAALHEIDRTMGTEGEEPLTEEALVDYVAFCS